MLQNFQTHRIFLFEKKNEKKTFCECGSNSILLSYYEVKERHKHHVKCDKLNIKPLKPSQVDNAIWKKESLLKWNSKKSPRKVTLMQVPFSLKIGLNYKLDREALYLFSVIETKWKNTRNLTNSRDWRKGYTTTRTVVLFGPSHLPALKNFISLLYYQQLHLSS